MGIIFESNNLPDANDISKCISEKFGFEIKVVIRDKDNISILCKEIPMEWNNDTKQRTDILFLNEAYCSEESLRLLELNPKIDNVRYISGAIIWNMMRLDYSKSGMNKFIGTTLYKNMTARNINTVRKLNELMS